ncbi:MAG: flagellar motor switch protein FliN [Huintestinicola sp.]
MSDESVVIEGFGDAEKDAIGEIMNITMGSAATAVSNMLSAKVWITTPTVSVVKASELVYPELEPSVHVKIEYIQGVFGQNVLVLKQEDVQLILCQLMGMPLEVTDDFEFDEMNISAVCEVMNQMMGSSATALSELINTPIDISTPQAVVNNDDSDAKSPYDIDPDDYCCMVKFKLTIDGVINSEFISVMTIELAKEMAKKMMSAFSMDEPEPEPAPEGPASSGGTMSQEEINALLGGLGSAPSPAPIPEPSLSSGGVMSQDEINALLNGVGDVPPSSPAPAPMPSPSPAPAPAPQQPYAQAVPQQGVMPQQGMPQQNMMPQQGMMPQYMGYPSYGYSPVPMQPVQRGSAVNVQAVQLQSFENYNSKELNADQNDNLKLLMNVPLNVTVEIGSAQKKVKDILDFSQGTIIELERQAGAPVDVIVNGHLIAKGDVVVIDDNFAVRITEIIKSKFLDNLGKE